MPEHPHDATSHPSHIDPARAAQVRDPLPHGTALLRGLLGWVVLCIGLGISIGVVEVLDQAFNLPDVARFLVQAAVMAILIVPTILLLRARLDRRPAAGLGWSPRVATPLALGLGIGLVAGVFAWVPALLAGWIRIDAIDPGAFAWFLVLNGLALAFYEALPEELALRGYTWTNLRDGWGPAVATTLTTLLFPFGGIIASTVAAGITATLGVPTTPFSAFPADPVAYVLQLVLFGLTLIAARRIPVEGALFVAVAFHWTQLSVTRALLGGLDWMDSGWSTTFVQPDAIALVLVHIVLGGFLFIAVRKVLDRRRPLNS